MISAQSLIRGIDRVLIHTQDVERVFARLRHEFGLPIAWPITDRGLLVSGGLHAGNMNIEIGRFTRRGISGTWLYGLGLAPSQWEAVNGLASRNVRHAPPVTLCYEEPVATRSTLTSCATSWMTNPTHCFDLVGVWVEIVGSADLCQPSALGWSVQKSAPRRFRDCWATRRSSCATTKSFIITNGLWN